MLTVRNLSVKTANRYLLNNINVSLCPGELTIILGANGAGKSTFINAIAGGDSTATASLTISGQVFYNEQSLQHLSARTLAKKRAVMPQQVQLSFPFKVKEVILMGRSPHGISKSARTFVSHSMDLLEISHLKERFYPSLSGGEQQRVQLARVLCQVWHDGEHSDCHFLLLDECTSALDPAHQHLVFEIIQEFTHANLVCCAIMHDLQIAAQYGERILLMKSGKIIADGKPKDVMTHENLAETYNLRTKIIDHPQVDNPIIIGLGRHKSYQENSIGR